MEIDTPEIRHKEGVTEKEVDAGKRIAKWVEKLIKGQTVIVESYKDKDIDKYGRYLANIIFADGDKLVNLATIMNQLGFDKKVILNEEEKYEKLCKLIPDSEINK